MAELEVIKHTKKIMATAKNKEHSLWMKIKEILLEVFIIVFAVSISIWFHNLNTEREDAHKESEFFDGVVDDLKKDIEEWKIEKAFYSNQISMLNHQICIGEQRGNCDTFKHDFNKDNKSVSRYTPVHNSHYEATKSSGNFSIIKNKELLLAIINYYQEAIPFIEGQKDLYNEENTRLLNVYRDNAVFNQNNSYDFATMLKKPAVIFQLKMFKNSIYIVDHYSDIISKSEQLIEQIEKR